jgi:hypothetical protein
VRTFMTRAIVERTIITSLFTRVLTTAAPAKPSQPFTVGVASDDLTR